MKVVDIIWETDGDEVDLPTEMDIPDYIDPEDDDAITDYLSDETGWLVIAYTKESEYEKNS